MIKTPLIIEQHFHGAYGINFNKCTSAEITDLSQTLKEQGIGGFFPTLVSDSIDNTKKQISVIKKAALKCKSILGIHLEGIFLNPLKKGIHNIEHFLEPTIENFKKIEDDFIKIVTLAPELDNGLIDYLKNKKVKVQAGHCVGWSDKVDGVTHIFNAMPDINHHQESTTLKALVSDNIYTEVIADGIHVNDDSLKLLFKSKPADKIILISDALPIAKSNEQESEFAGSKIFYDGIRAVSSNGTIAGSTKLLPDIIKILGRNKLFNPKFIENVYRYHNLEPKGEITWDEEFNITDIKQ